MGVGAIGSVARQSLLILASVLLVVATGCRSRSPRAGAAISAGRPNAVISHWDEPLRPSVPASSPAGLRAYRAAFGRGYVVLNSRLPFNESDIPLLCRNGRLFVDVSWSDRKVACMLDTGLSEIRWPQWLHLGGTQIGVSDIEGWIVPWRGGVATHMEWMLTPRISVGSAVFCNVPTEAVGFARPSASEPMRLEMTYPILGIDQLTTCVMTLDYRHKQLILRDPSYNVARQPRNAESMLIHFHPDAWGRVVLPGTLAGRNARFMLDTGLPPALAVTSSFARKYLSSEVQPATGKDYYPFLKDMPVSLYGKSFRVHRLYVFNAAGDFDVLVGMPFFATRRVTIDRQRGLLLLEKRWQ